MPMYEYGCKSCGHAMEARQKFSDAPLTDCPACGQAELERLVSASSFALKGGGWYADGYGGGAKGGERKKAGGDAKPATPAPAPAPASTGSGSSD
jgi:putative FmdB family regulatory protein